MSRVTSLRPDQLYLTLTPYTSKFPPLTVAGIVHGWIQKCGFNWQTSAQTHSPPKSSLIYWPPRISSKTLANPIPFSFTAEYNIRKLWSASSEPTSFESYSIAWLFLTNESTSWRLTISNSLGSLTTNLPATFIKYSKYRICPSLSRFWIHQAYFPSYKKTNGYWD